MDDMVPPDEQPVTRTEAEGVTVDLPEGLGFFTPGQVLGDRYEILEMLGRGGMGEVWRAFDLKLRVEVGLKALREELFQSERRLELLRQEVRAAREVISPNVCRIFDLIEIDGRELVSMEYVDGATLLGVLQERGPLELKEAQDIASQFLAGLEAIHKAGLVHRDVKPENIMLTRAGRVVVMDFGLARGPESGAGSVSGTPAYMAPEHAAGQAVDARADVYSAGVVLAEMVSPDGVKSYASRQSVWEGVRSEPAKLPDSPWAPVIKRAVARDRERRQNSAHTLIRELEDVTLRVEGAEDLHPYPGLASFTESDAEFFFGRESEVEAMWRKLEGPPRMLGLVGPSGAGKSSFIKAGVIPNAGTSWGIITSTPGGAAFRSLRQELASELAGDADAMRELVDVEDLGTTVSAASRWRRRHTHALLVIDQFEELFTQNAPDEQRRFAELLNRLVLEADVVVILSMRDDFLMRCRDLDTLKPIFADMTALPTLSGAALRRALTQPALQCGYRFEDDALVEEMLTEVEGERGALPLLAFAAARLWEKRDRDTGLLTRQAYHDIGGVGGALARHAEATIDRIGIERISIVRELFRNLVTAEGTRAVREWDELLSVFSDGSGREGIKPSPTKNADHDLVGAGFTPARDAAAEVLAELIDARLLTSYEVREDEHEPIRRVEIIHESLLANWPRLVRWQTQDADAVQIREQLRRAARTWDERDRPADFLWAGSAYREYAVWRERYPGGLTGIEEAFAAAMTALATRRRRRRRLAAATMLITVAVVAVVFAGLWRRSVSETLRAEAAGLLTMAQLQLDEDHTAALAWATASLELSDTPEARRLAVRALWRGPPYWVLETGPERPDVERLDFSPDGRFLAAAASTTDETLVWSQTGEEVAAFGEGVPIETTIHGAFFPHTSTILGAGAHGRYTFWSVPDFELLYRVDFTADVTIDDRTSSFSTFTEDSCSWFEFRDGKYFVRSWPTEGGAVCDSGVWDPDGISAWWIDSAGFRMAPNGSFVVYGHGRNLVRRPVMLDGTISTEQLVGRHPEKVSWIDIARSGDRVLTIDETGAGRLWSMDPNPLHPLRTLPALGKKALFDGTGRWIKWRDGFGERIFDLEGPHAAAPTLLTHAPGEKVYHSVTHPEGRWIAAPARERVYFWPVGGPYPHVLHGHSGSVRTVAFVGDGSRLATASNSDHTLRLWPLSPEVGDSGRVLWRKPEPSGFSAVTSDTEGNKLLVSTAHAREGPRLVSLDADSSNPISLWPHGEWPVHAVAFSPDGRLAAGASVLGERGREPVLRVWELESREERVFPVRESTGSGDYALFHHTVGDLRFTPDGGLLSCGGGGIRLWNIETGEAQWLLQRPAWMWMSADRDARRLLTAHSQRIVKDLAGLTLFDRQTGASRAITSHGKHIYPLELDPTGSIVVTAVYREGTLQVGSADGSEPHLLLGHEGEINDIAISPDSRWIATAGEDSTVRLWPMPDLSKPPLHTLPREELIAKLKTLTNVRVVRDSESTAGWKLEVGHFPGWETVPEW